MLNIILKDTKTKQMAGGQVSMSDPNESKTGGYCNERTTETDKQ